MVARVIKTGLVLMVAYLPAHAETCVLRDDAFPYRIVCQPEWIETLKDDSTLILDNTSSGKKMRFQLKKYQIDTSFNRENMEWSRLNFAINTGIADNFGRLIWIDSGAAIKLGNYRAFEMFAFFSESTATQRVWWAEYCRWTDHDGVGFLVSIIGDTAEMKSPQNYVMCKSIFDSTTISNITTLIARGRTAAGIPAVRVSSPASSARHDLLGREMPAFAERRNLLVVGKRTKRCRVW